jgi:hypothetical protein
VIKRKQVHWYDTIYIYIYKIAIGLTPGDSSTVYIYKQTVQSLTLGGNSTVHIYKKTVQVLTPGGSSTVYIYKKQYKC